MPIISKHPKRLPPTSEVTLGKTLKESEMKQKLHIQPLEELKQDHPFGDEGIDNFLNQSDEDDTSIRAWAQDWLAILQRDSSLSHEF